jgi:hypothetical protein
MISGGQTGADRGGLDAAIECDVPHGGWCPRGRKAEDGTIPSQYQLRETDSSDYDSRTEANVVDSDATVIFTLGSLGGGSLRTIEFCHGHEKPWFHADLARSHDRLVTEIVDWLEGRGDYDYDEYEVQPPEECILNVAGARASKVDGIQEAVKGIMVNVIREVNARA